MYEVTATRRRPQKFEDLVGQEFVAETLRNSIKSGQIAHAYLFSGPRGCGKTSTARILAKALNCESGPTPSPCGTCAHCKEITAGSSLDVIEIDGASNTSVNDVRQIKDEVMFPPNSSRYKIYIIDEVHMLSTSAFNALLKTIEEPPPYVIFIFATTELQKVPATIKSRCQQFNFRLVPVEQVKNLLADASKELHIQADEEALYWIARESTGSIRDAYTLFDQVAAFSGDHITYEKIRDKLGLVGVDRLNSIFTSCAAGDTAKCLMEIDSFLQAGISIEQLISNSADYIRSLLLIKNGITKEALLGNASERYSAEVLKTWNAVQIERALSIFLQLYRDVRYSLSPRYELELAFSRMCWLKQYVSSAEVKAAIDAAHALLVNAPHTVSAEQQTIPQNTTLSARTAPAMQQPALNNQQDSAAQANTGRPAGMPRFSQLTGGEQTGETVHPFHDGGALPPEQTVPAVQSAAKEEEVHADSIAASVVENSGWENTTAAPDDEYPPEENDAECENGQEEEPFDTADESADSPLIKHQPIQNNSVKIVAEPDQTYTTAEGRTITLAQLRGSVIADMQVADTMIASALMQTGPWHLSDDVISAEISSSYQKALFEQKTQIISTEFNKVCGRPVRFTVTLRQEEKVQASVEIPVQVKVLCSVFKGNIVGGRA